MYTYRYIQLVCSGFPLNSFLIMGFDSCFFIWSLFCWPLFLDIISHKSCSKRVITFHVPYFKCTGFTVDVLGAAGSEDNYFLNDIDFSEYSNDNFVKISYIFQRHNRVMLWRQVFVIECCSNKEMIIRNTSRGWHAYQMYLKGYSVVKICNVSLILLKLDIRKAQPILCKDTSWSRLCIDLGECEHKRRCTWCAHIPYANYSVCVYELSDIHFWCEG